MTGFLFDENLPRGLQFTPSLPVEHARDLGAGVADAVLWEHAGRRDLVIVTKDADFSALALMSEPPPRVVHLRFGNLRLRAFRTHLVRVWPRVEALLADHKLIDVYLDRVEAVA